MISAELRQRKSWCACLIDRPEHCCQRESQNEHGYIIDWGRWWQLERKCYWYRVNKQVWFRQPTDKQTWLSLPTQDHRLESTSMDLTWNSNRPLQADYTTSATGVATPTAMVPGSLVHAAEDINVTSPTRATLATVAGWNSDSRSDDHFWIRGRCYIRCRLNQK